MVKDKGPDVAVLDRKHCLLRQHVHSQVAGRQEGLAAHEADMRLDVRLADVKSLSLVLVLVGRDRRHLPRMSLANEDNSPECRFLVLVGPPPNVAFSPECRFLVLEGHIESRRMRPHVLIQVAGRRARLAAHLAVQQGAEHLPREGGGAREGGGDPRERRDAKLDTAGGTLLNERAKAMERDSTRERDDDR